MVVRRFLGIGLAVVLGGTLLAACATTQTAMRPRAAGDDTRSGGSLYGDFLVATYAGSTRDARVAAARYQAALSADPTNLTLLERAFVFSVAAGDMDQAARLAPYVAAANPVSDLAPLIQGVFALKGGQYENAKAFFTASHPPGDPDLMGALVLAWTAVGQGDAATGRALLKPQGGAGPDVFLAYHRARVEEALRNNAGADAAYKAADEATGGRSLTVTLAYATWLQSTARADAAEKVLKRFLDATPGNPVAQSALAKLRAGQPVARRLSSPQQGAGEGFYGIASAVGDGEVQDAAIVYLRLALYLDPQNDGALTFLAGALERANQYDEAIATFRSVPKSSPFYVTAQVSAADLLDKTDRTAEAIALLSRLERDDAEGALAASALGDVYRVRERWSEAADAYTRAIERSGPSFNSEDWPLFYARGIALHQSNRWPQAESDLRMALKLSPEQPLVLNYLAYSWIERGERVDEALAMLQRAVDQRPDDGYIIDSLGWAYYRLGQYERAVQILEQALQFSAHESTVYEHLGDAYAKTKRLREAQFMWGHALKLKPDPRRIPIIQVKLREGVDAGEALERRLASTDTPAPAQ